jgi:hypothetical protein
VGFQTRSSASLSSFFCHPESLRQSFLAVGYVCRYAKSKRTFPTPRPGNPLKSIPKLTAFYRLHFNLHPLPGSTTTWVELASPNVGWTIALHQAAVTQKSGAAIKLVFAVKDVRTFKAAAGKKPQI